MTGAGASRAAVLAALALPRTGVVYDLDPGRFPGMPHWEGHPPFQVVTYRTPNGLRIQRDQAFLASDVNKVNIGIVSEMIIATTHTGAHIDSLSHVTTGADDHWYNGVRACDALGDFGPVVNDASTIPPLIGRGVLVDIPRSLGVDRLGESHPVMLDEFRTALDQQGIRLRAGDTVLVRTGQMAVWPDKEKMAETAGAGVTLQVADYCAAADVVSVGTDTPACEVAPSIQEGNPHPVHERLLVEAGIYILENIYLEDLARDGRYEFLFMALAPKIAGATAGMIRPIAIA